MAAMTGLGLAAQRLAQRALLLARQHGPTSAADPRADDLEAAVKTVHAWPANLARTMWEELSRPPTSELQQANARWEEPPRPPMQQLQKSPTEAPMSKPDSQPLSPSGRFA